MHVFNSLVPVFAIIAVGNLLRRNGFISMEIVRGINRLTYWIGLPSLLFVETAKAQLVLGQHRDALIAFILATIAAMLAGYLMAFLMRLPRGSVGAFVQICFRGNLAFIGLPVIIYSAPEGSRADLPTAILLLAALVIFYNLAAVVVILLDQPESGGRSRSSVGGILLKCVTNPLALSCVAGLVVSLCGWSLPVSVGRTLEALGQMALPLALLGIGGTLRFRKLAGRVPPVLVTSLICVAFAPLCGYLISLGMGLSREELRIVMIYLACPTAAAGFVLVDQLGGDRDLAAAAVVMSTLLSMASLSAVVALFGA